MPTLHPIDRDFCHLRYICGRLAELDLTDLTIPINEVCAYLTARYSDIAQVHPRLIGIVVSDVFKNLGYKVRVTSYSKDQGIDLLILDGRENKPVGVQVKRSRNAIQADQIREFAGALVLGGLTRGVFVTTGRYTKGAHASSTG